MTAPSFDTTDDFQPVGWASAAGNFVFSHRDLMVKLGELETRCLSGLLEGVSIDRPIYVCGLARSGSTILLEALSRADETASHRYQDFPFLYTPFWWSWFLEKASAKSGSVEERAHGDGLLVDAQSPEAMEEPIWRTFFPDASEEATSAPLYAAMENERFDQFYRDHLKKMIATRGGSRYLAKGNYNISRLPYILKLFSDARFVIPIREPAAHVASMMRQHENFLAKSTTSKALDHLRQVGHFEFGPLRRPIDVGAAAEIADCWAKGDEVRGWAKLWASVYGFVHEQMTQATVNEQSIIVVRHEDLIESPDRKLAQVWRHCALEENSTLMRDLAQMIHPSDHKFTLTDDEASIVREETEAVASSFGYFK